MQDKFHILKPAVDTPETGNAYPAADSFDEYDFDGPNSVHKLTFREMPDFEPDIRFRLANGAKLTDILSQAAISAHGLLINSKAKMTFESLSLPKHKFFPATLTDHKNIQHQYYWMHLAWSDASSLINYPNSKFYKRKFSNNLGHVEVSSGEEFWSIQKSYNGRYLLEPESICFTSNPKLDIFVLPFKSNVFHTNNGIEAIKKLSGLEILRVDALFTIQDLSS